MEPQMNADERRYNINNELERTDTNGQSKLAFRLRLRILMIRNGRIFINIYYPCVSASSAESVFYPTIFRLNKNSGFNICI